MCFGGGGDSQIAQQQRADEVARQARIKSGMASVASIFDGGKVGSGAATSYDPSKTYYLEDGSEYKPNAVTGGMGSFMGRGISGMIFPNNPDVLLKAGKLFTGTTQNGGFNDDFYQKRANDYVAYATPELERQAKEQHEQLIYALARTGNLDSSAAIRRNSDLNTEVNKQRIGIANDGINQANTLRGQVEQARGNVVAELNATGDSSAASAAALRNVQNLNQPAGYSPLGNLFSSFAQGVSQIGSNAGNGYSGFGGGNGSSLFRSSGGSQRVVGG